MARLRTRHLQCGRILVAFAVVDAGCASSVASSNGQGDSAATVDAFNEDGSSSGGIGGDVVTINHGDAGETMDGGASVDSNGASDAPSLDFDVPLIDAPGACNDFANGAPAVNEVQVASNIPAPSGGTIADGVYFETAFDVYTGAGGASGPDGKTHRFMALIRGGQLDVVYMDSGDPIEHRVSALFSATGTTMRWTFQCPSTAGPLDYGYDATAMQITLYNTFNSTRTTSFTLTKQ